MDTSAATLPAAPIPGEGEEGLNRTRSAILIGVLGLTAAGIALRFSTLGLQSYHHDEVITVMRVIPGSFGHMLEEVKRSESNPPLYYVLAWFWAKLFGSGEVGMRSLTALFGAATVPLGYFIGRQLVGARTGLALTAMLAVNPMLIWYSQEARSYALLIFFGALSVLFFLRALDTRANRDLTLWAVASAFAICSHYFAFFLVGIEGLWLLVAMRSRWRSVLPALAGVGLVGLALVPLILAQVNPKHIGWIEHSPLLERLWETASAFTIGETGHVIAEPPRDRYAIVPLILIGASFLLIALRGDRRERRGAKIGFALGLGIIALATAAALVGKDYVVERNLLPALVPLAAAAAIGFTLARARRIGLLLVVALSAYWLAFDIHVTETPNLQRPNLRAVGEALGPAARQRATVSWKLAGDPIQWYLHDHAQPMGSGDERLSEINIVSKPLAAAKPVNLPPSFRLVQRVHLERLTLSRYISPRPVQVNYATLHRLPTGFGNNDVILDGPAATRVELGAGARTAPTNPQEEG